MSEAIAASKQAASPIASAAPAHAVAGNEPPYLRISGVVKKFGDHLAVDHIDLDIRRNEIFALLGSSGCGKSTLLRMLAGMETPTAGRIILDGQDMQGLRPYERPVNMMFQNYALFPHMTVEQNVAFGLKQDGAPRDEIAERVAKMLDLVQMRKYAGRKPHQLSGGQQQRVALARSLVKRPKLLLLDEPLGALDKKLRQQTQLELVNTIEAVGVTCIMVTHDQEEAMTMSSRIGIMSEGKLLQVGTPTEIYEYPSCRFTAEFIGETNMFEGAVVVDEPDRVEINSRELGGVIHIDHGITGPRACTCGPACGRRTCGWTSSRCRRAPTAPSARCATSPIWAATPSITCNWRAARSSKPWCHRRAGATPTRPPPAGTRRSTSAGAPIRRWC
ncbi:Spermidine/putrescine import ATP-binding protein PotA [Chromobacterium violaceum]|uniref:Spermidine/putrescine import ATP-binding protein PotA n=1 Tax=Chromobacterium violaceum TaxID=536 RepID=A0A447T960_CHRVL|nr:Spermidine/putrescine import ATP-binding protein PotA [Chromobacterium violaceum]